MHDEVRECFASECHCFPLQTAENFRQLCTGEAGTGEKSGKPLHFKGSCFHRVHHQHMRQMTALVSTQHQLCPQLQRLLNMYNVQVIKGFMLQGGDITAGNGT